MRLTVKNTPETQKTFSGRRKEIAQALGISVTRLGVLIRERRISEPRDGNMDYATVRREYLSTLDPDRRARFELRMATEGRPIRKATTEPGTVPPRVGAAPAASPALADGELVDFAIARTKKEMANARRAEFDLAVKTGQYVMRNDVLSREFAVARKLRDRILGFPARLANLVPPDAMHALTIETEQLVRELQEDAARICESNPLK